MFLIYKYSFHFYALPLGSLQTSGEIYRFVMDSCNSNYDKAFRHMMSFLLKTPEGLIDRFIRESFCWNGLSKMQYAYLTWRSQSALECRNLWILNKGHQELSLILGTFDRVKFSTIHEFFLKMETNSYNARSIITMLIET